MAGQQPVEDGRERPYVPATHVSMPCKFKGVDGRDKPGHDDVDRSKAMKLGITPANFQVCQKENGRHLPGLCSAAAAVYYDRAAMAARRPVSRGGWRSVSCHC